MATSSISQPSSTRRLAAGPVNACVCSSVRRHAFGYRAGDECVFAGSKRLYYLDQGGRQG